METDQGETDQGETDRGLRGKLDSIINVVESDFIYSLIFPSEKAGDVEDYLDFFRIRKTAFYFMTVEVTLPPDSPRENAYRAIRESFPQFSQAIVSPFMRSRVVAFVPAIAEGDGDNAPSARDMRAFAKDVASKIFASPALAARIGVGSLETDFARSREAYGSSLRALGGAESTGSLLFAEDSVTVSPSIGPYPAETERKVIELASLGDVESATMELRALSAWLSARYPGDIDALRNKLYEILSIIRYQARERHGDFGGFDAWMDTGKRLREISGREELERFAAAGIEECAGIAGGRLKGRISPFVIRACTIINERLSGDISLEEIARRVEISPFYFSKLFKEETGANFIDYLTMARIERAKGFLRDKARSVKEISAAAGYADANYFSKLFKKVVGLTPTEYRSAR